MDKLTPEAIDKIFKQGQQQPVNWIKVGMSTCGIAAGADEVYATFVDEIKKRNIQIAVKKCGCLGMCHAEPLVEVCVEGMPTVIYGRVNKEIAVKILDKHVNSKALLNDYIFDLETK